MIVPFYVEMSFDSDTHKRAEAILAYIRQQLKLPVYQGPPNFGEDLMELEARLEGK